MGLTQHEHGFENIAMLLKLLMLKGNIGREGTGISPVRGHSNVQGQRTVGIATKPALVPLDKYAAQFGFEPPRDEGLDTVKTCEGILVGNVRAFIGLGGNFLRAIPERAKMEEAWRRMRLTVQVATKLNRSHLINGEVAYLLPCLGRTEEDIRATGAQSVTMEDTFSCIYGSSGRRKPASEHLKSEVAIVSEIAKATLEPNPKAKWDEWSGDYAVIRDCFVETYRTSSIASTTGCGPRAASIAAMRRASASLRPRAAAVFTTPTVLSATGFDDEPGRFRLVTMRSNDQFNTTIYGYSDRMRGIEGTRDVLLINPEDMARAFLVEG
jgi:molybdopterin-dependent oxidoreductase alpha subunit